MILTGRYKLLITGDTEHLFKVSGSNRDQIGYLFQRLLTGEFAGVEQEMGFWGIKVTLIDDEVEIPIIPQGQFAAVLDAEPTPEMIEAGWGVLPDELVDQLPAETMEELWKAMERAR